MNYIYFAIGYNDLLNYIKLYFIKSICHRGFQFINIFGALLGMLVSPGKDSYS